MALKVCILSVAILTSLLVISYARIFTSCSLARILASNDIPKKQVPDWICLAKYESSLNSRVTGPRNRDGSRDYGIFQINSRYWCSQQGNGNGCNVQCSKLLDDNIKDDIQCAKKIYSAQGFSAWVAWKKNCKGHNLSTYVQGCSY